MKAVIAFGGNAIARAGQAGTFEEQLANVRAMCEALATLVERGDKVIVTHGNGPQVGQLALQQDIGRVRGIPGMPFDACGSMTQGLIGYMLQQTLGNTLAAKGSRTTCTAVVTQVVVAADDPAFSNPTKPVGQFYSPSEADALRLEKQWTMVEDAGRGYRRVVPSPRPLYIVEWPAIAALVEADVLVIAAGGGGAPVVEVEVDGHKELRGVEAVIDKDRASALLASLVDADTLVLLTDVERAAVDYGTPAQRWLDTVSTKDMQGYLDDGQFPPGSMGPKVESALRFLTRDGRRAIITSTGNLVRAVLEGGGTRIVPNGPALTASGEQPRAVVDGRHG